MKANLLRELVRVFLHEAGTKSNDEATRLTDIAETLYARANAPPTISARRGNRQQHDDDRGFRGPRPTAKDGAR